MRSFARVVAVVLTLLAVAVGTAVSTPPASAVVSSHLALSPGAQTLHYGTTLRFTAHLAGPLGGLPNSPVTLWRRASSGTAWARMVTLTTNDSGDVAYSRVMTHTGQWQARYGGSLVYDPAATTVRTITVLPPPPATVPFGVRVVREAARHRGAPYQYGAAGPYRFDCSGFTRYVLSRFHIYLSHNAAAQYGEVRHVSHASKRLGDLIFFRSSGGIYHVGVFAGNGRMWAAPHTGDHVRLESIYSASYLVGRPH
jgi:cell wall-associated NlpC family hydrolase